jgi:hypothetical protein
MDAIFMFLSVTVSVFGVAGIVGLWASQARRALDARRHRLQRVGVRGGRPRVFRLESP